jgi:hypothetical protein
MLAPHTKTKHRIRVTHSRKVIDSAVEKLEGPPSTSCASLVYAGYPYDPYAQA